MRVLDSDKFQLSIVPGPPGLAPSELLYSTDLSDLVDLDPAVVAQALLALPGIDAATDCAPTSWDWEATFVSGPHIVRFEMTLFEPDAGGPYWGGFSLHGYVTVPDLCRVARELRRQFQSVWIHDGECRMFTPEAFEARYRSEAD
jgi:hypothetical protein